MKNLNNKIVVVTGCTGGIGKAVCRQLYSQSAVVIGINKSCSEKNEFVTEQFRADLSSFDDTNDLMTQLVNKYGVPDIIVHCSGLLIPSLFRNMDEKEIKSMVDSNLYSLFNIMKTSVPYFEENHSGHYIIISSLGGIIPMPYSAMYSAMKFAVRGFCISVFEELKAKGINVSLVSPGPVKTGMLDTESADENSTMSFIQKPMDPEVIAETVMSLIHHPKLEKTVPGNAKIFSILLSCYPGLLHRIFPLLKRIGKKGMIEYRKNYLTKTAW